MPNQLKNQFLILGLTGPLGSGCSMIANFLSGMQFESQITIEKSLHMQVSELKDLDVKIKQEYLRIQEAKKSIKSRLNKKLGHLKADWINPCEDKIVQSYEKEILRYFSKLKFYTRRREIYKSLKEFLNSNNFSKTIVNDLDEKAFGMKPFSYISFTTIITKFAHEHYVSERESFKSYFAFKIAAPENRTLIDAYLKMKDAIEKEFQIDDGTEKSYITSNRYMRKFIYKFAINEEVNGDLKRATDEQMAKFYRIYWEYIFFIKKSLKSIKDVATSKGKNHIYVMSEILQDWGDNIRATGNPYRFIERSNKLSFHSNLLMLSNEINVILKAIKFRTTYLNKSFKYEHDDSKKADALFVIECLRNPSEVEYFRSRYAEFYLLSLSAKKSERQRRIGENFSEQRDQRDQGRRKSIVDIYKLDVRSCVLLSDIAISNNHQGKQAIFDKILRYFSLIRNPGCIQPNNNELYMHIAYSHSLKSACISRKVGAVILGPRGYILGAGWNDPGDGQIGCSMRNKSDLLNIESIPLVSNADDLDKFKQILEDKDDDYICYKDIMSQIYTEKKINQIKSKHDCPNNCFDSIASELGIKRLEYCRSLHAEENAILQSAKIGGMPIENGTIYTTTYPCELCAKKLYQIGIRTIYYTEPYPESISEQVFLEDGIKVIERIAFEGVKSYSFFRLFKPTYDKKDTPKNL